MPLLGLFELLIAHVPPIEQAISPAWTQEAPVVQLPLEQEIKVVPFFIEGSVDDFDSIERARKLTNSMPRKWCGTYSSFNDGSNVEVTLDLIDVQPIGQIVDIGGEILIGGYRKDFRGNLNAKSNQTQFIIVTNEWIFDIEPGGTFVGLGDAKKFVWNAPRLNNRGGILDLSKACDKENSKAQSIFTVL